MIFKGMTLVFSSLLFSANAIAGEHQEKLAKCLVDSTSQQDKNSLVQWIFVAMSAHPLTSEFATVPTAKRKEATTKATAVFEKLMTDTCGVETLDTIKFEGTESLGKAFETLGNVAMEGLLEHPSVEKAISDMAAGLDQSKFEKLIKQHKE